MDITAEVLDEIALCADRNKDVRLMLLDQLLQEIRDVKILLQKSDNTILEILNREENYNEENIIAQQCTKTVRDVTKVV